jgi:hypothetical protein
MSKLIKEVRKIFFEKKVSSVSMYYLFNEMRIWQRVCILAQEEKIMGKASRHRRNPIAYQLMDAGGL